MVKIMADSIHYECPYCGHHSTLSTGDYSEREHILNLGSVNGAQRISTIFLVCQNPECKGFSLRYAIDKVKSHLYRTTPRTSPLPWPSLENPKNWELGDWKNIIPRTNAKTFPDYIPQAIREDYEEACMIRKDSPKASATLCRRCLQGMIRDFHGIQENTLFVEIDALKDIVDPTTWQAIDAIRKTGNIGAHMEKDVNEIIDVEPEEASKLIWLIETLIQDWYITKHEKEKRLQEVIGVSNAIEEKKEAAKVNNSDNQDTSPTC